MLAGCAIGLAGAAICAPAGPAEPLLLVGAGAAGAGATGAGAGLLKIPDKNAMIVFQSWLGCLALAVVIADLLLPYWFPARLEVLLRVLHRLAQMPWCARK